MVEPSPKLIHKMMGSKSSKDDKSNKTDDKKNYFKDMVKRIRDKKSK